MMMQTSPVFREVQRFHQWWIWLIVLAIAVFGWWGFVQQILYGVPFGTQPAPDAMVWVFWVLAGVAFPIFLTLLHMVTEVRENGLVITFFPVFRRRIPFENIHRCETCSYDPILHYGGWGIRWNRKRGWAFNVSGHQGVRLILERGQTVLVGSQRATELEQAITPRLVARPIS
jgi:hypothetical protein